MLFIQPFVFNPFQENTYLLTNEHKECWIIDPGMYNAQESSQFLDFITTNQLKPQAIINTHTHIDHIFGVQGLIDKYNIPFGIHQLDTPVLNNAAGAAMMFGFDLKKAPAPSFFIKENEPLLLGEDILEVRFVPGHSPGSIAFYNAAGRWAISGDVIFQQSIGRTDLPGGSFDTLINSIRTQLFTLPDETTIHSGHGAATTIGVEKRSNPFLTQ
ncbi:MAG: MBL fold metallo-hydrolase [Taibaiella sp.]|nr:MBL fold metallo-hydrolase [Taibaiella sp.]